MSSRASLPSLCLALLPLLVLILGDARSPEHAAAGQAAAQASAVPPDTLWTRSYGGSTAEQIRCISQTSDSGYVFTGYVWFDELGGQTDVYVGRLDAAGDTLWTTHFGGPANDVGYAVRETQDAGYIVAGYTSYADDPNNRDVYLVKLDSLGGIEWAKTFGGPAADEANDVQVLVADGGFIIAGYTRSFGAYGSDVYLIRTYSSGDTIATRHHSFTINDNATSICEAVNAYFVCGHTQSPTDYDLLLMKTTTHLDPIWSKTYGGEGDDIAFSVQPTLPDLGCILAGETSSFGAGSMDGWALKTDQDGDTLWTRTVGDPLYNRFFEVDVTDDGGYVFGGMYGSVPFEDRKFYAAKLGASGGTEWTGTYGPIGDECVALSMVHTFDGGYVMGGYLKWTESADMDAYVIKLGASTESAVGTPAEAARWAPVAFPNPSVDRVRLVFDAQTGEWAECLVYGLDGRLVARTRGLISSPGTQTLEWDGRDLDGKTAPTGVYFYKLEVGDREATGKVLLAR